MPGINSLMMPGGPSVPQDDNKETQAQHATAPQVSAGQEAKTIVLSLLGFMILFYLLHLAERWANKA